MLQAYAAGELFVDHSTRLLVHKEISEFNPLVKDNKDNILDLLTYAPRVMQEYKQFLTSGDVIEGEDYYEAEVLEDNTEF
tara:strand:- start:1063 stop:1302 length:240 start_codon:yes stop_codon:yes gene_type:complete